MTIAIVTSVTMVTLVSRFSIVYSVTLGTSEKYTILSCHFSFSGF